MSIENAWLPLFPLKTVLFPGGVLHLKVFETRYMDMVRDCMKRDAPFGVVLIKSGQEVGMPAEPEAVGCLANISSWEMPQLGVMMLRTVGSERFRILDTRVCSDQRLEAKISLLAAEAQEEVSEVHLACAKTLKIIIEDIDNKGRMEHGKEFDSPFEHPPRLDDAGWVANRWCEILPIPLKARQALLELDDAESRLSIVHQYLEQHEIIQ